MDKPALISLTFDDGLRCQFEQAVPILDEYAFPATFFLTANTSPIHIDWHDHHLDWRKIEWNADDIQLLKSVAQRGHEIGSQYRKVDDDLCQAELLRHLNGNLGYYLRAVWMLMDAVERRLYLERALTGFASILDYIDDTPTAVSGNWVAFPFDGPLAGWVELQEEDPKGPHEDIVALPTRGLFAEAQLGHCNSCEVDSRQHNSPRLRTSCSAVVGH